MPRLKGTVTELVRSTHKDRKEGEPTTNNSAGGVGHSTNLKVIEYR